MRVQQTRHQRDEVASLQDVRDILQCGSSQTEAQSAPLKHQTSHMSEEIEDNL